MAPVNPLAREKIKRILIRGTNWIGDTVITLPALAAIRKNFPSARISILVRPWVADILRGSPLIDELIIFDKKGKDRGISGLFSLAKRLRRKDFQLAILLQNAFEAALIAFLAAIPERWGYATDGRSWLLTRAVPLSEEIKRRHQMYYYLELLSSLGLEIGEPEFRLSPSIEENETGRALLAGSNVDLSLPLVGINPGATYGSARRWYPERFAAVADQLIEEFSAEIIIFGGKAERDIALDIIKNIKGKSVDLSGKADIASLIGIFPFLDLLITNDSGPMHLAAALSVPVVAIFGPTDPATTSPFGDIHSVVRVPVPCSPCLKRDCPKDHRCMKLITPEMVFAEAAKKLEMIPKNGRK
jgi:heptosyltransferase-2